jgi:tRNA 2-thiouridine synthesizing protein E
MALEVDTKVLETTESGFLVDAKDWTERVAQVMAQAEGIELTPRHWDVINYLREQYFGHGEQPTNREMLKAMQEIWQDPKTDSKTLYALFPGNPSKQAGRIAGLPESKRKGGY